MTTLRTTETGDVVAEELLPAEALPAHLATGATARREAIRTAARRSLARRRAATHLSHVLCGVAAGICLVPLVSLLAYTTSRGIHALNLGFLVHDPTPPGIPGGGIRNAIAGSALTVGLAALMAIPVGIAAALFLLERKGRLAGAVRFGADVLTGVPSIAVGIFAYVVLVEPLRHFSALAGSLALAVLMLPIVIRASEAAMRAVPIDLREAALALGARRSRVARSVVLRGAMAGLVTGSLLAIARAVGETAPLLFTSIGSQLFNLSPLQPTAAMPLVIYADGTQAFPEAQQVAWGTAFVLLVLVLLLSVAARIVAGRLAGRFR
ncbi:MAG: phosphate ABC transporter permease PstA [Candidatus Dormibacteria bacterium]